ncbi:MAG: hypothetical protein ACW99U_22220, partial [Candidatus Thorarchaeota archaeon]
TVSTHIDISYTAVQTGILNFHAMVGEQGLPVFMNPTTAIVSGQDQFNAADIFMNNIGGMGPMRAGAADLVLTATVSLT